MHTPDRPLRHAALVSLAVAIGVGVAVVGAGVLAPGGFSLVPGADTPSAAAGTPSTDSTATASPATPVSGASDASAGTAGTAPPTETPAQSAATPEASTDETTDPDADTARTADAEPANATWTEYRLVVAFRNDDIQPYYEASTMRAVDDVFVEEGVPVTNAVIPFVGGENISEADDTCRYLRELGRDHPRTFEFALHGYTHENRTDFHGSSEFGGQPYETQLRWMQEGTDELVACTGDRPTTFVPPMNTYDENTTRAAAETNYTTVSGGSWFTRTYYGEAPVFENGSVVHVASSGGYVEDWTTMETKSRADLTAEFDEAYADGGTFVMMIHYPDFDTPEKRADLRALLEHAKSREDVRFVTVGELGSRVANGTMERTDDGWRVYE
ncbi:DUF2334 domain-containing protein [Halogeometricum luteum]|uniref:DUF2334 domain-containing protein n=1 Tax=Halogeometricum luteum TaxID=2950537 RepID=A0ABU2G080_9EURY|nr:DUF2334 domain-containing protein [Halogeometricum sp. S3BR5-2]MDS0294197.1 DUF2334 domain-containing protein [Halogeometricum sp. S3BR5-2]